MAYIFKTKKFFGDINVILFYLLILMKNTHNSNKN